MAKRTIATYTGPSEHTRILDVKTVNEALKTNLTEDLVWNKANRWMVDVTDAPKEVLDYLEEDESFKLDDREVGKETTPAEGPFAEPSVDAEEDDEEDV